MTEPAQPYDASIRGTVVTETDVMPGAYVAIRAGRIAAIGTGAPPPAVRQDDHGDAFILPGLVDGHMHTASSVGWPGIEGATRSAAAGGVTTVVDMPYDIPRPVTDATILGEKIDAVNRTALVDVALYGTITKHGGIGAIAGLAAAGVCSFKLSTYEYSADRFPRIDPPTMRAAFAEIAATGRPVSVHNENQELCEALQAEAIAAGRTDPIQHARTRPPVVETLADLEIFELALETGAHVHIAHSSLARGFEIARTFRAMGARATGEACIQYLCLTEDDLVRLGGRAKCNPPVRSEAEVERIWASLAAGDIAYVSTDHAPWPLSRKIDPDIFKCSAGLTGLQTFAPLMATLLLDRSLPLTVMARFCAAEPARHHGLYPTKGALRAGSDADLLVLEPGEFVFDEAAIQDRPEFRWSPFHGRRLRARVAATYLRGQLVWDGATVLAAPGTGRYLPRLS